MERCDAFREISSPNFTMPESREKIQSNFTAQSGFFEHSYTKSKTLNAVLRSLKRNSGSLSAAYADGGNAALGIASLHRIQESDNNAGA